METDYLVPTKDMRGNIILDTTLHQTTSFQIDEMNGDWGDAGRKIYLHVMGKAQSNSPKVPLEAVDLTGRDVRFQGVDADGKIKVIETTTNITDARSGLLNMTLPRQVYQAVGRYDHAEFEVYEIDGDTKVSTVPVTFEVHDHQVIVSVGASEDYIDSIEKLKQDIQNIFDKLQNRVTGQVNDATAQLDKLQANFKLLEQKLDLWDEKINNKGIGFLQEDNVWNGSNEFKSFIKGFTTGNVIQLFDNAKPQQDIDSIAELTDMPAGTTKQVYYAKNKVLHNPLKTDYVVVITMKIATTTAFQFAMNFSRGISIIKARYINNIATTTDLYPWYTIAQWSDWISLEPYLNKDWVTTYAGRSIPQYRYEGSSIRVRGKISPKGTIPQPTDKIDMIEMTTELPINEKPTQYLPNIWTGIHPYTLRLEDHKLSAERIFDNGHNLMAIDNGNMFILSGTFGIDD